MKFANPACILITGASSGIGEALALHYAKPDVLLCLTGRDEKRLADVAEQCEMRGAQVRQWIGDVTDEAGIRDWIFQCDAYKPLNLVIANAGVGFGAIQVDQLHDAAKRSFEINVNGVFNTIHPALEVMSKRKPYPVSQAQVAIMSSIMGYVGMARSPAYSSSKATAKHYGQALRGAFRAMGIGVSVICPGYVETALTAANASKMPFIIPADQAAKIIAKGLAKDKGRITFPWQVVVIARVLMNLPYFIVDRINKPWGVPKLEEAE